MMNGPPTALFYSSIALYNRMDVFFLQWNIMVKADCLYPVDNMVRFTGTGHFGVLAKDYDWLFLEAEVFLKPEAFNIYSTSDFFRGWRKKSPNTLIIGLVDETAASSASPLGELLQELDGFVSIELLLSYKFNRLQWDRLIALAKVKRLVSQRENRKASNQDVFICHASEDKASVVEPLVEALHAAHISCWYDKNEIAWGDRIVEKINEGLKHARYVLVVLSEHSVKKSWPKTELASALQSEISDGNKRILPLVVSHADSKLAILNEVPLIRDKRYLVWEGDSNKIANELLKMLNVPHVR